MLWPSRGPDGELELSRQQFLFQVESGKKNKKKNTHTHTLIYVLKQPEPSPPHMHPLALLWSILCACCSCDSAESPRCNFLFALSWTETHQCSAEPGEGALLTGSPPSHLSVPPSSPPRSSFIGYLSERRRTSGPVVAPVWIQKFNKVQPQV